MGLGAIDVNLFTDIEQAGNFTEEVQFIIIIIHERERMGKRYLFYNLIYHCFSCRDLFGIIL